MASPPQPLLGRCRRDSIESLGSLWEKTYESNRCTKQEAPFENNGNFDLSDNDNPIDQDDDDYDSDANQQSSGFTSLPASRRRSAILSDLPLQEPPKPWEQAAEQDQLIIIFQDETSAHEIKRQMRKELTWTNEEAEIRPWHFGLTAIHLCFKSPRPIDLRTLVASSIPIPCWLSLKRGKIQTITTKEKLHFSSEFNVSLCYGALSDLNEFYYSPQHLWRNEDYKQCSLFLDSQSNGRGNIEWLFKKPPIENKKKQLLVQNIDQCVIVDLHSDGFRMYICQKCNMNEFDATATSNRNETLPRQGRAEQHNNKNVFNQRPMRSRERSQPRAPPPLLANSNKNQPTGRPYQRNQRASRYLDSYFSTVQFSLRAAPTMLKRNDDEKSTIGRIRSVLSLLIECFLSRGISVSYGKIEIKQGPDPCLFLRVDIPDFPSLLMNYSWQMLSTVGYRLQIRINKTFIDKLIELSREQQNADELFYRVCVYLSRIFVSKPFVDINAELDHAKTETKRKRDASAYGLISALKSDDPNWSYIPSVTLTPTTIRIKPLKLCRTNRVLRADEHEGKLIFGNPIGSFVLVDIRDENGTGLASYHFRDIRPQLLLYLQDGFSLMRKNRIFKYLHHSQSQLRERQFWFYHHNDGEDGIQRNKTFPEAYDWMGDFEEERNPVKCASRIAQCFSTTRATVEVPKKQVLKVGDIHAQNSNLLFTDGCGTMSVSLRNKIKKSLGGRNEFSAVQLRYAGAKGVVSLDPRMTGDVHLCLRESMVKFKSEHRCFEVCKISAPRPIYLNRQAIMLLSFRKIPDACFLVLQQKYHLKLVRNLLRNADAEELILEKLPRWLLPRDIHAANIDYIHEPFFRQILINACLQSTRDLLRRTRIRISPNEGRNMIGIVDEYNVLKAGEVFIQYTRLSRDPYNDDDNHRQKTTILKDGKVVITKNPCHHPGDIRTFNPRDYPELRHLKDVIVFSQQGDRPAPHDISGSDLDGDEYLVIWHKDLVPYKTDNAEPYDYDSKVPPRPPYVGPIPRDVINNIVLDIAEQDCLGQLSNIHLAFADRFGVDSTEEPMRGVLSTIKLAGAISEEVDSAKTGHHPLNSDDIRKLNQALDYRRPDYADKPGYENYKSEHILGKLFRASRRTLPGWNQLLRYHRHLRHLKIRTNDPGQFDEDTANDNDDNTPVNIDESFLVGVNRKNRIYIDYESFAKTLVFVYRQEILEILNLYGLSHESDVWCRNLINANSGELEDTALIELEQLVVRTRAHFFNHQASFCETGSCDSDTPYQNLCDDCKRFQQYVSVACYYVCYDNTFITKQSAPILSLPWLFATALLQGRLAQPTPTVPVPLLSAAMQKALDRLLHNNRYLQLRSRTLTFNRPNTRITPQADVDLTLCAFIEILQQWLYSKSYSHWTSILSRFVREEVPDNQSLESDGSNDEWKLNFHPHKITADDEYASLLSSMKWIEETDKSMHDYFNHLLQICFDEGREKNDLQYLDISETIILFLQKVAINETIF